MDELELSEQCMLGDTRARRELYERYAGRMLAICRRYAGDCETAKDWMHDGFVQILAQMNRFVWRGEGSLRAWMDRVMVNTILQHLRKNDILANSTDLETYQVQYEEPEPEEVERVPVALLMQWISELPVGYRTVFNLYVFEQKSHREIADILKINEKSSASQFSRAKATLAKRVKTYMNE